MSQFETLIFGKSGPLAHISLNRPQVLNAYNMQMRDDFYEALSAVDDDPEVGALVVTGEGRAFCARGRLDRIRHRPISSNGPRRSLATGRVGQAFRPEKTRGLRRPRFLHRLRVGNRPLL